MSEVVMGDPHDYVALEWVKGEIAETLKQARYALEACAHNPEDLAQLRYCLTYVHQVRGALHMVEFFGAAMLAEEMEQLTQALLDNRVNNAAEARDVLMQALLHLPLYLDRIQTARCDLPMAVLPLLNDLRATRGEKLLSDTRLFTPILPDLNPPLSTQRMQQLRVPEMPVLLKKLRQMLQVALAAVFRGHDVPTHLGYMAKIFARLEILSKGAPLEPLWCVAAGLIDALINGSIDVGASVHTLLRHVDRELHRLVIEQVAGLNQPAPAELIKNLLFYVAKAQPSSPRLQALHAHYQLAAALPNVLVLDQECAHVSEPDRMAIRSVVAALCEELVAIKDSLDLFVRSAHRNLDELEVLQVPLKQMADTFALLGFAQLRQVVLEQLDLAGALSSGEHACNDAVLLGMAGALLSIEATLTGMVSHSNSAVEQHDRVSTADIGHLHRLVIKEARAGLEQAKDGIVACIASQNKHDNLADVAHLLNQVRGGLIMISLTRAAALIETCQRYIKEQLFEIKVIPDWHDLDTFADAVASIDYYLERLAVDYTCQGESILEVAYDSLSRLGYTPKSVDDDAIASQWTPEAEDIPTLDVQLQALPRLPTDTHTAIAEVIQDCPELLADFTGHDQHPRDDVDALAAQAHASIGHVLKPVCASAADAAPISA